ncbi:MAG: hypothetical protein ACRC2S_24750 [Waterburya sp.]
MIDYNLSSAQEKYYFTMVYSLPDLDLERLRLILVDLIQANIIYNYCEKLILDDNPDSADERSLGGFPHARPVQEDYFSKVQVFLSSLNQLSNILHLLPLELDFQLKSVEYQVQELCDRSSISASILSLILENAFLGNCLWEYGK